MIPLDKQNLRSEISCENQQECALEPSDYVTGHAGVGYINE